MRPAEYIKQPTVKELFTLRFMIVTGVIAMAFFLYTLFSSSIIDNPTLYWLLIIALLFTCIKIMHEWYHYFYITVPSTPPLEKQYTVDIFTTYCAGEPYEMMLETLTAIQAIKYPHTTYLCDEADDPYLKDLCKKLGINHITRTVKINAKAGNINNALQYATGEICVILDPDHVPFPEFLDPIVSHFNDPEIGFVQIVQAYKNFHEGLIAKGAAQQTFQFYGPMMMTMNKYGTVLAIGANCTFRRAALDSIGGHAAGLAEDMHTAMQLHAKGWKSLYVPAVLARGLVPSTLSAYYSQQLKWSRGVFELLVTSYPKLFKKLTWRQKLHYGIIPFYYLSGLIFLINFLIPVLSLFLSVNPIKMDFQMFALIGLPLFTQIILVRTYVQRWVMEDEERGFHIVGGLLMMGTWWIFITGLIYTIIRKKVPYVPTPKDDSEENNWPLNIPNLLVLAISLTAIAYGLINDWNPYTFIMAGLAVINCLIILFNIVASRQLTFRKLKSKYQLLDNSARKAFFARKFFWKMRIMAYAEIRKMALVLTLITIGLTGYFIQARSSNILPETDAMKKSEVFLNGIFAPTESNGLSSVKLINSYGARYDIISLYISWGDKKQSHLPLKVLDSIYGNGAVPMITWEPWQNLFSSSPEVNARDVKVFKKITEGKYDVYLSGFANEIRLLNRPVFIRFAHEADNPFYPWSSSGDNTASEFKAAWKYVHNYFRKQGAYNVTWVWNPWKADAVNEYFPGKEYVDWIGITNLNYGNYSPDKKWYSMEELYAPFHKKPIIRSGIPVMLAEMGSLNSEGRQNEWFRNARESVKDKFPEIKALVLFNNGLDKNMPVKTNLDYLDWKLPDPEVAFVNNKMNDDPVPLKYLSTHYSQPVEPISGLSERTVATMNAVRGINYSKGLNWMDNYNTLRNKEINADFKEIKGLGFNTIKRYGPAVYDRSIFEAAINFDLKLIYGFYIPEKLDFLKNQKALKDFEDVILKTVKEQKDNNQIIAWNFGNTPFQKSANYYIKPELTYYHFAYANWMKEIIRKIKQEDPMRPVSVDVELADRFDETMSFLNDEIPEIDLYGLIFNDRFKSTVDYSKISKPYFLSKINASAYLNKSIKEQGVFIADWQDQERSDLVTFDGIKDNWGKNKVSLYRLKKAFTNMSSPQMLPRVKILKPAVTIYAGNNYSYHALVEVQNEWVLADSLKLGLKYKWYLVKTDHFGNGRSMKFAGSGAKLSLKVPDDPQYYELYLNASKRNDASTFRTSLKIPLVSSNLK